MAFLTGFGGRLIGISILVLGVTNITGCVFTNAARYNASVPIDDWQRWHVSKTKLGEDGDHLVPPVTNLGLATYISEALDQNPEIQTAIAEVYRRAARIDQVTALPDPILKAVTRPEPIQTAAGDVVFTLVMSQKIPFPPRLMSQGRIAVEDVNIAIENLNVVRLQVVHDIEQAYFSIYLMDRYVELARENIELLEDLEAVVVSQYQVGQSQQADVLRLQSELASLRNDERRYHRRRLAAVAMLNQLTDSPVDREVEPTEPLDTIAAQWDVKRLLRLAEQHNPEVAGIARQLERDREKTRLAALGYWPDVTLGVEWNHLEGRQAFRPLPNPDTGVVPPYNRASENGDDNWAIMVQINLPIWRQRVEATKREARQNVVKATNMLHTKQNLVAAKVFGVFMDIESRQETVELLKSTLVPQAHQAYEVSLAAYRAGESSFIDIVENWRQLLVYDRLLHSETVNLELAFSELQQLVGIYIERQNTAKMGDEHE